jgi:antitoxin VapB
LTKRLSEGWVRERVVQRWFGTISCLSRLSAWTRITNARTHRLVEELAKRTGESMTAAVTIAVRERLDRIRNDRGAGLAERLLRIGQDCAKRLKEPYRSASHDALFYDDRGLPR